MTQSALVPPETNLKALGGRSLDFYLGMLTLSILVPAMLMVAALLWNVAVLDGERANREALQLARGIAADLDREIEASIQTLLALGTSSTLRSGDFQELHRQARDTLARRKLHALVRSLDGQQFMNTRVAWGTPLPTEPLSSDTRLAIESGRPHVTGLIRGAVAQQWVIGISVPVIIDDRIAYVLTMSIAPEQVRAYFLDGRLDTGWNVAVSDNRRIIARAFDHDTFVGQEASPDAAAQSVGTEGVHRVKNLDGIAVVRGYKRLERANWIVGAFVPTAVVDAPFRRMWVYFGFATVGLLMLAVPLSLWVSRLIARPIVEIAALAVGIGRGVAVTPILTPLQEANIVAKALAATAEDLHKRTAALSESEARFRSLFHQAAVGVEQVGLDGRLLAVNDRLCSILGYTQEEFLQRTFVALTHADDVASEQELVRKLLNNECETYEIEKRMISRKGEEIWVRVTSSIVRDTVGNPLYRTSVIEDVSERRRARAASARLVAIVQSSQDALVSTDAVGTIETWNPSAETLLGFTAEAMIGQSISRVIPPDRAQEYADQVIRALAGASSSIDTERAHYDGSLIEVSVMVAPIMRLERVIAIAVTMRDIRERKKREALIMLLNRELQHRVKNSLAVVQSIANQTVKSNPTPEGFRRAFQGRMQALAAANDLLMVPGQSGSNLIDFVKRQLAPLVSSTADQLIVSGPTIYIPPDVATSLGLALHELGTNALKYGAWSVPGGQVTLTWQQEGNAGRARIVLRWKETHGPRLSEPTRTGFGSLLIDRGIPGALVERRFEADGLLCLLDVPLYPGA